MAAVSFSCRSFLKTTRAFVARIRHLMSGDRGGDDHPLFLDCERELHDFGALIGRMFVWMHEGRRYQHDMFARQIEFLQAWRLLKQSVPSAARGSRLIGSSWDIPFSECHISSIVTCEASICRL
jgi:hypothetical protein